MNAKWLSLPVSWDHSFSLPTFSTGAEFHNHLELMSLNMEELFHGYFRQPVGLWQAREHWLREAELLPGSLSEPIEDWFHVSAHWDALLEEALDGTDVPTSGRVHGSTTVQPEWEEHQPHVLQCFPDITFSNGNVNGASYIQKTFGSKLFKSSVSKADVQSIPFDVQILTHQLIFEKDFVAKKLFDFLVAILLEISYCVVSILFWVPWELLRGMLGWGRSKPLLQHYILYKVSTVIF